MLGATLAGLAFGVAGTAAAHAIQYPIGALTHTAHGTGVACLMPYVMAWNRSEIGPELNQMAGAMGLTSGDAVIPAISAVFAGVALDGAVLQIDDAANLDAYGSNTTPRMIFEGRAAGSPSMDVVAFRDRLEEATYAARNNRSGNGGSAPRPAAAPAAAPAPVQAAPAAPAEATTAPLQNVPQTPPPQQQGFQPVNDGEIRTETLGGN